MLIVTCHRNIAIMSSYHCCGKDLKTFVCINCRSALQKSWIERRKDISFLGGSIVKYWDVRNDNYEISAKREVELLKYLLEETRSSNALLEEKVVYLESKLAWLKMTIEWVMLLLKKNWMQIPKRKTFHLL